MYGVGVCRCVMVARHSPLTSGSLCSLAPSSLSFCTGTRVPTLAEALELIKDDMSKSVVLDLKVAGLGAYIVNVSDPLGVTNRVSAHIPLLL